MVPPLHYSPGVPHSALQRAQPAPIYASFIIRIRFQAKETLRIKSLILMFVVKVASYRKKSEGHSLILLLLIVVKILICSQTAASQK